MESLLDPPYLDNLNTSFSPYPYQKNKINFKSTQMLKGNKHIKKLGHSPSELKILEYLLSVLFLNSKKCPPTPLTQRFINPADAKAEGYH